MPEEGSYIPKFKVGQTIAWNCPDDPAYHGRECIIFSTYRTLDAFGRFHSPIPADYNDSEPAKVMYAVWSTEHKNYHWIFEHQAELVCSNANRGKRILIQDKMLSKVSIWFDFSLEGEQKFQTMLDTQPPEDS